MKRYLLIAAALWLAAVATAADGAKEIEYVDAQRLNHIGKLCKTSNPYNRVEVADYPELNAKESNLLRCCAGEAILFETDAQEIWVTAKYGYREFNRAMPATAAVGFNLFIERDGEWLWAASKCNADGKTKEGEPRIEQPLKLIANMDGSMKRCILYLPLFAELTSLEIGVPHGAKIKAMRNPFRHEIAVFGSSYTHGSCATCAGMTYPAFLQRQTGLNLCAFGMSGNSKLQRVMGEILGGTKADAYICDAFSNPTTEEIGERIRPFIGEIRKRSRKAPIIFLRTIYREGRLFDLKAEQREQKRMEYVDSLMKHITAEFADVYYVDAADQTGTDHLTSADGVHPCSWGYKRWADAIQKPVTEILAKYGIE